MTYERGYCWNCGRRTSHKDKEEGFICITCEDMGLEKKVTLDEKEILDILRKSNLSKMEIKNILSVKNTNSTSGKPYTFKGQKVLFGVIGDGHCGHNCYDAKLMKFAAQTFNKKHVDFVIHSGDLCEGHYEGKRQGSIFELTHVGGDAQTDYVIKELKQIKSPLYFITGNHETNTFFKLAGFDIGKKIQKELPNSHYLGQGHGTIKLPFNQSIEVLHPDGGTAYAISYKPQKITEAIEGGTKPSVLLVGHFHKAEYLFYRNVHIFQTGCLQSQTPFMRGQNTSAHKGFWVIEAEVTKEGISRIKPEFYPAY